MPTITNRAALTASDLIGYEGKMHIRIKGSRRGRATWDTVVAGRTENVVALKRTETIHEYDGEVTTKVVTRHVEATTPVELLTKPVGLMIGLPGDSWMFVNGKQMHASGAIIEVLKVNYATKTVTGWVSWNLVETSEDVKIGTVGEVDSLLSKMILESLSTDGGWDGHPNVVAFSAQPKVR
jgi:hypothetical protein